MRCCSCQALPSKPSLALVSILPKLTALLFGQSLEQACSPFPLARLREVSRTRVGRWAQCFSHSQGTQKTREGDRHKAQWWKLAVSRYRPWTKAALSIPL